MTMRSERFLRACRREPVDCTPVWMMRQAGRYLPEYRAIRKKYDFLTMCKTPELAAEVTLQPIDRIGVDAAIIFADILLPLESMGLKLRFAQNEGPVIDNPVRSLRDAEQLKLIEAEEQLPYVMEALRIVRKELDGKVPLIGFAGAPFTLASYAIEGRGSRDYRICKTFMWNEPQAWRTLMDKLAEVTLNYLKAQVSAGAQALQLFDSWAGALSADDYREYALPYTKYILDGLRDCGVPVIHFANQTGTYLELIREAGGDVIGIDWRVDLAEARRILGNDVAIQGNLDPMTLFAPPEIIEKKVASILEKNNWMPGHIFNLGHGINKETPVEHAIAFVEAVHRLSRGKIGVDGSNPHKSVSGEGEHPL